MEDRGCELFDQVVCAEGRYPECPAIKACVFGSDQRIGESARGDAVRIVVAIGTPQDGSNTAQAP